MVFIKKSKARGHTYASIVKSIVVEGKRRHKIIKHLGRYDKLVEKLSNPEPLITLSDISLEKARNYGKVMVFSKISEMINLKQIINKHAKKQKGIDTGTLIEILSINRATEPKAKLQIANWYEKTVLPYVYGIPSTKLYPQLLCEVLDKLTTKVIFKIHQDLNTVMKTKFNLDVSSVIYDITSTYFEGEKCILAKFGYSRDHRNDKKQIVIGIVISLDKGIPVYHFVKSGDTADVSTQIELNEKLELLGIKRACVVHDRGMTSKTNLRLSDKIKYSYITALNSGNKHSDYWIKELKNKEFFVVDEISVKVKQDDNTVKKVKFETKITEKIVREHKRLKKYVLVYSQDLARRKIKARNAKILRAKQTLDKIINKVKKKKIKKKTVVYGQIKQAVKGLNKYFNIEVKEHKNEIIQVSWKFKDELKTKAEEKDGYFVLICSDADKSQLEIYSAFKYKCEIEAIIRELKNVVKLHPLRHWKNMRPEAQVFVCVMGFLLKKILKVIMNQHQIYDSVSCIMNYLDEVKTIEMKINDKIVKKNTKISQNVPNLFKILEINPEI